MLSTLFVSMLFKNLPKFYLLWLLRSQVPARYPYTSCFFKWQCISRIRQALELTDTKNGWTFPTDENDTASISIFASLEINNKTYMKS